MKQQTTLRAALFDLDGTLLDTEGQYSIFWGDIGRRYHPEIPRFDQIIKGTTLTQIFARYFPDPDVQREIQVGLDRWEAEMDYRWVPGAPDYVDDLRRHGVRCAIVTSSNQVKMHSALAKRPELATLFDRILTSEDFSASKPDPDCYLRGAEVFGADVTQCVVCEDAFTGLQAGRAAGICTIGLATVNAAADIAPLCDHVIADFRGWDYAQTVALLERWRSGSAR